MASYSAQGLPGEAAWRKLVYSRDAVVLLVEG